jgi:hypothetical protein
MDENYISMVLSGSVLADGDGKTVHFCERAEGWPVGGLASIPCPPGSANLLAAKLKTWLGSTIKDAMIHQTSELRDQLNTVLGVDSLSWGEALGIVSKLMIKAKVTDPDVDLYDKGFKDGVKEGMLRAAIALKDYEAARRKRLTLAKETRDELKSKFAMAETEVLERKAECDGLAEAMDMICNESDELDRERIR